MTIDTTQPTMDGLKEYQAHRLDLADMLRAALNIARAHHDDQTEAQARGLLTRLAADRFTVAVVGQFSRGKSTLMNALLGDAYLPTGVLPMTSVITTVRYGSRPRATYLRRDSRMSIEVPLADVPELTAQTSERRAALHVASVDIELPAEVLRQGIAFVDTPGFGSSVGASAPSTRQFLPQTDAVIFVTGFDDAFTNAEADLLREVGRHAATVFCVINKRDLVDRKTAASVTERLRSAIESSVSDQVRLFELSALDGLQAKIDGDGLRLDASGIPEFESALDQFLAAEKSTSFLRGLAASAADLVTRQRRDLRLGLPSLDGNHDREDVEAAFTERMIALRQTQKAVIARIRQRILSELPDHLELRRTEWHNDLRDLLMPIVRDSASAPFKENYERSSQSLQDVVGAATADSVKKWLARRSAEVTEVLIDLVPDEIGELLDLARSVGILGVDLAGMRLPEDSTTDHGWAAADVPTLAMPRIEWSVPLDHVVLPHVRPAAREQAQQHHLWNAIDRAAASAAARCCQEYLDLSERWVQQLAVEVEKRTREQSARFARNLHTYPPEADLSAVDAIGIRLDDFRERLSEWTPPAARDAAVIAMKSAPADSSEMRCVACIRSRDALVNYLGHVQYQLATRESDQLAHAGAGGFCPLHTWVYYSMASPLGISAGYAGLGKASAAFLEATAELSSEPGDYSAALNAHLVRGEQCLACRAVRNAERQAISDCVRVMGGEADVLTLCVVHLAQLCAAGPPPERARALLRSLAGTLRRDAEDMRSYALKREARYRSLISDEEAGAYLETLQLLAGDPALSRPSFAEKDLEFPPAERPTEEAR